MRFFVLSFIIEVGIMKKSTIVMVILIFAISFVGIAFPRHSAKAFLPILPFGGKILAETVCKNGVLLLVPLPIPGLYLLPPPPAAIIYRYGLPILSNNVLGLASPGGACVCPTGGCEVAVAAGVIIGAVLGGPIGAIIGGLIGFGGTTIPALGTVRIIGTSLPIPIPSSSTPIPDF